MVADNLALYSDIKFDDGDSDSFKPNDKKTKYNGTILGEGYARKRKGSIPKEDMYKFLKRIPDNNV